MNAEWNINAIAAMTREDNLLNLCRRFEQELADWKRPCTYRGCVINTQWPAIGELGRHTVNGAEVQFQTTRNRQVRVLDTSGKEYGKVLVQPGMADRLHLFARSILQLAHTGQNAAAY